METTSHNKEQNSHVIDESGGTKPYIPPYEFPPSSSSRCHNVSEPSSAFHFSSCMDTPSALSESDLKAMFSVTATLYCEWQWYLFDLISERNPPTVLQSEPCDRTAHPTRDHAASDSDRLRSWRPLCCCAHRMSGDPASCPLLMKELPRSVDSFLMHGRLPDVSTSSRIPTEELLQSLLINRNSVDHLQLFYPPRRDPPIRRVRSSETSKRPRRLLLTKDSNIGANRFWEGMHDNWGHSENASSSDISSSFDSTEVHPKSDKNGARADMLRIGELEGLHKFVQTRWKRDKQAKRSRLFQTGKHRDGVGKSANDRVELSAKRRKVKERINVFFGLPLLAQLPQADVDYLESEIWPAELQRVREGSTVYSQMAASMFESESSSEFSDSHNHAMGSLNNRRKPVATETHVDAIDSREQKSLVTITSPEPSQGGRPTSVRRPVTGGVPGEVQVPDNPLARLCIMIYFKVLVGLFLLDAPKQLYLILLLTLILHIHGILDPIIYRLILWSAERNQRQTLDQTLASLRERVYMRDAIGGDGEQFLEVPYISEASAEPAVEFDVPVHVQPDSGLSAEDGSNSSEMPKTEPLVQFDNRSVHGKIESEEPVTKSDEAFANGNSISPNMSHQELRQRWLDKLESQPFPSDHMEKTSERLVTTLVQDMTITRDKRIETDKEHLGNRDNETYQKEAAYGESVAGTDEIVRPVSSSSEIVRPVSSPSEIVRPVSSPSEIVRPVSSPSDVVQTPSSSSEIVRPVSSPSEIVQPPSSSSEIVQPISPSSASVQKVSASIEAVHPTIEDVNRSEDKVSGAAAEEVSAPDTSDSTFIQDAAPPTYLQRFVYQSVVMFFGTFFPSFCPESRYLQ